MKRRGVLGLLGGALAAGPAMAKEAVAGLESLAVPGGMDAMQYVNIGSIGSAVESYPATDAYNHGDWLREQLAEIAGITEAQKRERLANMSVRQLDPDLAVNRSFSLTVKIEMQKRRDLERDLASNRRHYARELADWLKRQALS